MEKRYKLLIIDDDEDVLLTARLVLSPLFDRVKTETDPYRIRQILEKENFDLVLMDMNYSIGMTDGASGMNYLKKINEMSPSTAVILMTAFANIPLAVAAMKAGANDFLVKPWTNEQLVNTIKKILEPRKLIQKENTTESGFEGLIGPSEYMQQLFRTIEKIAPTDANVLITGENGTGKELVARAIHKKSLRADKDFITVDMGAVPDNLLESELFGHKKGAFTDAREDRTGKFAAASGGTLFLDEIGNIDPAHQAKLLSALQNRVITPVGSNTPVQVDIRLVSATNADLKKMTDEKKFRQDLLYRLNTIELRIPALRERKEDIIPLAEHFMQAYSRKYRAELMQLSDSAREKLTEHSWPGNVRELQHCMERTVILAEKNILRGEDFRFETEQYSGLPEPTINLEELEKIAIYNAIKKHEGNLSKAAKELGLGRTTLYRKMEKYGI